MNNEGALRENNVIKYVPDESVVTFRLVTRSGEASRRRCRSEARRMSARCHLRRGADDLWCRDRPFVERPAVVWEGGCEVGGADEDVDAALPPAGILGPLASCRGWTRLRARRSELAPPSSNCWAGCLAVGEVTDAVEEDSLVAAGEEPFLVR
jgi:hypothetical protein